MPAGVPVVLGFDFGGTKIAVAICDAQGTRRASRIVDSRPQDGAEAALRRGLAAGETLLQDLAGCVLAAVGVATFGIPFEDHVDLAPAIPGWERLEFGRTLREAFPAVPVRMATDVKAAAMAEVRWGALAGCDPGLYLNLGTGLGAAIVVDGQVLLGAHGAAGEIGYNIRSADDLSCATERLELLEDVISGRALRGFVADDGRPFATAAELFDVSRTEPGADNAVQRFVDELAMHVANLAVAVDPMRIAVGGGMARSWARLGPGLQRALELAVPFPPELVMAAFPDDAPLIGALALGSEAAFGVAAAAPAAPESVGAASHASSPAIHHRRHSEVQS